MKNWARSYVKKGGIDLPARSIFRGIGHRIYETYRINGPLGIVRLSPLSTPRSCLSNLGLSMPPYLRRPSHANTPISVLSYFVIPRYTHIVAALATFSPFSSLAALSVRRLFPDNGSSKVTLLVPNSILQLSTREGLIIGNE